MSQPDGPMVLGEQPAAPSPESAPSPPQRKSVLLRPVNPAMILAIIIGVVVLRGWIIEGVIVEGKSMAPNLREGERLLVVKKHYSPERLPSRGDVIIFPDPEEGAIVVKRVIGLPGERVDVMGPRVYINGQLLREPYAKATEPAGLTRIVPQGRIWVMGDNRDDSADSREYGTIRLESIRGRAVMVMWPFPFRVIPRTRQVAQ